MPDPSRRVVAAAMLEHLGAVQNLFDAPAESAGSFSFGRPNRLQDFDNMRVVDRTDGQAADALAIVVLCRFALGIDAEAIIPEPGLPVLTCLNALGPEAPASDDRNRRKPPGTLTNRRD
jgi:hypothetical protein